MTGIFNSVRPKRRYFIALDYAKAPREGNAEQLGVVKRSLASPQFVERGRAEELLRVRFLTFLVMPVVETTQTFTGCFSGSTNSLRTP